MNKIIKTLKHNIKRIKKTKKKKNKSKSNVGIEIEICIKTKTYNKMKKHPFIINKSNYGQLLFDTDPSCLCNNWAGEGEYTSAELISPKLTIPQLDKFMNHLFNRKNKFRKRALMQGTTCGVHIHWSNKELFNKMKLDNPDKLFFFINHFYRLNNLFEPLLISKKKDITKRFYEFIK